MTTLPIPVDFRNGTLVCDSRHIADAIGIESKSANKLIEDHIKEFEQLGVSRFEIDKPRSGSKGGRPEKYMLLNEDQAYLMLALVRTNQKNLPLKLRLIQAFRDIRNRLKSITQEQVVAFQTIAPRSNYGVIAPNGLPKVSIRNAAFVAAQNPSGGKLKSAHNIYQVLPDQLDFFWLLGSRK